MDCSLSANDSAPPGWSELGFHAQVTNADAADTQVLSFACVSSSAPLRHTLCTEFGLPARCSLALSPVPSLFLAYGRALFVVLSTRPQLRGRSNNVQVVDIKSSLNPPTAIYSGTRHLDCGWGPKEFDQLPPPKASTVRGITRKLASPVQLSEPLGRRSTGSNAAEKVSSLDKALLHFIPVFGLTAVRHDHGLEISRRAANF